MPLQALALCHTAFYDGRQAPGAEGNKIGPCRGEISLEHLLRLQHTRTSMMKTKPFRADSFPNANLLM